jgi:hypothetical protein
MNSDLINEYGPLAGLLGVWEGDRGMDVAPEPDGTERSPYYETITFTPCGSLKNAEEQVLASVYYRQIVRRKSNDDVFHDQTGYWIWDAAARAVMNSFTIPRAVCVLAGGQYSGGAAADGSVTFAVRAAVDDPDWQVIQSPFMQAKARTTSFTQSVTVQADTLTYTETTMLDIYGKTFEHTDGNTLKRVAASGG